MDAPVRAFPQLAEDASGREIDRSRPESDCRRAMPVNRRPDPPYCIGPADRSRRREIGGHRVRTTLLSILVALLLLAGLAPGVSASDGWCDTDPVLLITTPSGSQVPVFVNTGARGAEHLPAAQIAQIAYTATPKGNDKATNVTVTVVVPSDAFRTSFETRSGVSTGAFQTGTVYAQTTGYSAQTMTMQFVLSMP